MDRLGWILEQARTVERYNSHIDQIVQYSDQVSVREASTQIYGEIETLSVMLVDLMAEYEEKYKNRDY